MASLIKNRQIPLGLLQARQKYTQVRTDPGVTLRLFMNGYTWPIQKKCFQWRDLRLLSGLICILFLPAAMPPIFAQQGVQIRIAEIATLTKSNVSITDIASRYTSLLNTNLTSKEACSVCDAFINFYASTPVRERDSAILVAFADKALTCQLNDLAKCRMLVSKGGALLRQSVTNDLTSAGVKQRKAALLSYLQAFTLVNSKIKIDKPMDLPAVGALHLYQGPGVDRDFYKAAREEHERQVNNRKYAEEQNDLWYEREYLVGNLRTICRENRKAFDDVNMIIQELDIKPYPQWLDDIKAQFKAAVP